MFRRLGMVGTVAGLSELNAGATKTTFQLRYGGGRMPLEDAQPKATKPPPGGRKPDNFEEAQKGTPSEAFYKKKKEKEEEWISERERMEKFRLKVFYNNDEEIKQWMEDVHNPSTSWAQDATKPTRQMPVRTIERAPLISGRTFVRRLDIDSDTVMQVGEGRRANSITNCFPGDFIVDREWLGELDADAFIHKNSKVESSKYEAHEDRNAGAKKKDFHKMDGEYVGRTLKQSNLKKVGSAGRLVPKIFGLNPHPSQALRWQTIDPLTIAFYLNRVDLTFGSEHEAAMLIHGMAGLIADFKGRKVTAEDIKGVGKDFPTIVFGFPLEKNHPKVIFDE